MGSNHHRRSRFNKSDEKAKRILFELFYDRVYQTAYYIVKDAYLAQDIAQETFIKAFRNLADCPDGEKAGAWLATIATRTAIDHIRWKRRRNDTLTDNVLIDSVAFHSTKERPLEIEVENAMMVEQIMRRLQTLDPEQRRIIVLKYLCELKDEEIADVMELKVGTVKSRIHRIKNKLRSLLLKKNVSDGDPL